MTETMRDDGADVVVLLGAARSGTKLVRDVLASSARIGSVPYDINFIWRIGNERKPDDELEPGSIGPRDAARIRRLIRRFQQPQDEVLVEKTVASGLRVEFIRSIFPKARFIHLHRNGIDVVESVARQYAEPTDWSYLIRKARAVPLTSAPGYLAGYAWDIVRRRLGSSRVSPWGPVYRGMTEDLGRLSILEVSATQWSRCVMKTLDSLAALPDDQWVDVAYESFVTEPQREVERIAQFLGIQLAADELRQMVEPVHTGNVGRGQSSLDDASLASIAPLLKEAMNRLGYPEP